MLRRVTLFILTNLSVMLVFGMILYIAGIQLHTIYKLVMTSGLIGCGGAITSLMMSREMVLRSVHGEHIEKPINKKQRWLIATIKQQTQMLNIPMPDVYIYDAQHLNAFATGSRKECAVVGVSSGLLKNMKISEIEAVLAHEICHIFNGDMVTMTLLQGIINTFVGSVATLVADVTSNCFSDSHQSRQHHHNIIYNISSKCLQVVFGVVASLILNAFSRYREFYADAGSASMVGVEKMIAALKRLKLSCPPQEPDSIQYFCINGKQKMMLNYLFKTHPSIDDRIEALVKGKYLKTGNICQ